MSVHISNEKTIKNYSSWMLNLKERKEYNKRAKRDTGREKIHIQ